MPDAPRHHDRAPALRPKPSAPTEPAPNPASNARPAARAHVNLDRCRLSLIKGEHRWRFRWERGSEAALISAVADLARNPQMNFDWFDAAIVCRHIAQSLPTRRDGGAAPAPSPTGLPKK